MSKTETCSMCCPVLIREAFIRKVRNRLVLCYLHVLSGIGRPCVMRIYCFKYLSKCAIMLVCKYANMHVCQHVSMQMYKYAQHMWRHANAQVCKYAPVCIIFVGQKCFNLIMQICKYQNFRALRALEILAPVEGSPTLLHLKKKIKERELLSCDLTPCHLYQFFIDLR